MKLAITSAAARPASPPRLARFVGELGWLLLFVLLFPLTVLMVGSLVAIVVNAAIALLERL